MKAQSNTQKTVRNQVSKMVLVGSAVIFSLVLTSESVKALDLKDQFLPTYNYGKMAMYFNEQPSENKKVDAANPANNAEVNAPTNSSTPNAEVNPEAEVELNIESTLPIEDYNAKEFVDPEMDREIENWKNSPIETPNEDVTTDSEFQIQGYNAKEFVDAEIALEIENWTNNEKLLNEAEAITAKEADAEIEKYADKLISMQQKQSKQTAEVSNEEFVKYAEQETAQEADLEVEKYASILLSELQNEDGNFIAGNGNQK